MYFALNIYHLLTVSVKSSVKFFSLPTVKMILVKLFNRCEHGYDQMIYFFFFFLL